MSSIFSCSLFGSYIDLVSSNHNSAFQQLKTLFAHRSLYILLIEQFYHEITKIT